MTVAVVPLNFTPSLATVVLKFVPTMVTLVPAAPVGGEKLVIVGGIVTVKLLELVAVDPPTVTEIVPVVAPEGTDAMSCVVVADVTVAVVP